MDTLVNFVLRHQELSILFLILVMGAISIHLSWYKKHHDNELPPRTAKIVVLWVGCSAVAFAGFCIGVLASHK